MRTLKKTTLTGGAALLIAMPFVAGKEGLRNAAYYDPVQIPTICYGHTKGVTIGQVLSDIECEHLLAEDLGEALDAVDRNVKIPLPDTRKAALGSFIYNIGEAKFKSSTLLKKLNAGDVRGACSELPRWIFAKGIKLNGLVKRRAEEMKLCMEGL